MNKDNGSYELFKGCQMRSVHLFMKEISILIVFVFILQILTPVATVWAKDGGTSSTIAGVEITVKKQSEIEKILVEAITNWKNRPLIIEGQSGKIELSTQKVQFDIKETVRSYTKAIKKPWYKVWRSAPVVHLPLQVELGEDIEQELMAIPFFKVDETKEEVLNHARYLKTTEIIPVELPLEKEFMERNAFSEKEELVTELALLRESEGEDLETSVQFIEHISYPVSPLIIELNRYLDEHAYLRSYSFEHDTLSFAVDFETITDVSNYVDDLLRSPYVKDVIINGMSSFDPVALEEDQFKVIDRFANTFEVLIDLNYLREVEGDGK